MHSVIKINNSFINFINHQNSYFKKNSLSSTSEITSNVETTILSI